MAKTLFITGTDTEIGKTHVACGLIRAARGQGLRVAAFKPVAAGCESTEAGPRNPDALALIEACGRELGYDLANPYALAEPIAPHIAAADAGVNLDRETILACHEALAADADLVVVEGAGGWRVPLGPRFDFADLAAGAEWPVLLVVGMRLGCINHALLTAEAVAARTGLLGWVANCLPPVQTRLEDNIAALRERIDAPLLGITWPDAAPESGLDVPALLGRL